MNGQSQVSENFEKILKETITPRMKALRFKKVSSTFSRSFPEFQQIVNIQKSQWNHKDSVSFTINIGFYNEDIHKQLFSFSTPKYPKEYDCFVRFRSESITQRRNEWYELDDSNRLEICAEKVATDLDDTIFPLLGNLSTLGDLANFWIKNEWLQKQTPALSRYIILSKLGKNEEALNEFADLYNSALFPKDSTTTINYPDGRIESRKTKRKRNQEFVDHLERFAEMNHIELNGIETREVT